MAPERVVLCGGATATGPGGKPLVLNIYGPTPNVHFRLQEMRRDLWRDIPPALRDLLDLAAYVYTADQAVRRADGGRVDGDEIGAGWRREFRFHVPVRRPDLWNSAPVRAALVDVLSFLSEDSYEFEFPHLEKDTSLAGFIDYSETPYHGRIEEVMMFSGGLDSLAGAVTEAVANKRRALLVNHRSNEKLTPRHRDLLQGLAERAGAAAPLHFPVRMNKAKRHGREHTQRTDVIDAAFGANAAAFRRRELPRSCLLRLAFDEAPPAVSGPKRPEGNYFVRLKRFWAIRFGTAEENVYPDDQGSTTCGFCWPTRACHSRPRNWRRAWTLGAPAPYRERRRRARQLKAGSE
jgi:hypothetical protein